MSFSLRVPFVVLSITLMVGCAQPTDRYAYLHPVQSYSPPPGTSSTPAATSTPAPASTPGAASNAAYLPPPPWLAHPPQQGAPTAPPPTKTAANATSGGLVLPPLKLPQHEAWSPGRCAPLSITFSGSPEGAETGVSDTASFEEARRYLEEDYEEHAECFCVKSGDLSLTDKVTADAVMAQVAKQLAESSNMRVRRVAFAEDGPLGKYSEIEAATIPPQKTLLMRTYWHGQCSMRVATLATAEGEARSAQFLDSLHAVTAPAKEAAEADTVVKPATAEQTPMVLTPAAATEQTASPQAGAPQDFGTQVKRRSQEINDGTASSSGNAAVENAASSETATETGSTLSPDASARLHELQQLRDRGLITRTEYVRKRNAILEGL